MKPRTQALLARLEKATYSERIREMMAEAQSANTDPQVVATLQELALSSGFYERSLFLMSCYTSRDGAMVLPFLTDSSRLLRGFAIHLIPRVGTDEQVVTAQQIVLPKARLVLLRHLRQQKRFTPIDRFLETLLASKDQSASDELICFASDTFLRRNIAGFTERFRETDWRRLSRTHPDATVAIFAERLTRQTESDPRLLAHLNAVLSQLAETRRDAALGLVRHALRFEAPSRLCLQRLAERCPNEMADLALATEDTFPIDFGNVASRLSEDRLLALLERRPMVLKSLPSALKRLAVSQRARVYAVAQRGWQSKDGVLALTTIETLPAMLREVEARRHLTLPALQTLNRVRLTYTKFLPWEEAQAVLEPFIKNPDADLRADALSALVGTARYHPDRLADALAVVRARNNEQDPVRNVLLRALALLPPSRWSVEHLDDLARILRDALDASDLSPATASEAEKLVVALVPFHPEWAAHWLATLAKERGQVSLSGLQDRLTDRDVRRIAPFMLPVLTSWTVRERQHNLIHAARAFGKRLRVFEEFGSLLEEVAKTTKTGYVASNILALLQDYQPERFARLVSRLLIDDKSVGTLPIVYDYLHRKRQDLITPFLGQQAFTGRFSTGRTRFVLPLSSGFERWTARQQEQFAQTLQQLIGDAARDTPAILQAITQLAALPAVDAARLFALADGPNGKTAIRDHALQSLARLDAGQGIPALIEALGDDRARVAIYALRSVIFEMPLERALALLQTAPTQKVTVAKEVVRLLGDLKTPLALPILLAMAQTLLHRDVRVALLRALWDHVEQDDTWTMLAAAAVDPDPAVARGVVRIPVDRLSNRAAERLRHLLTQLLAHADIQVRLDTLLRCTGLPISDPNRVLLPALLARLTSSLPGEVDAAAQAVFSTYAGSDANAVASAVASIQANRRTLTTVLKVLQGSVQHNRRLLEETTRAVLAVLADDPLTARSRTELAVAGLGGRELALFLMAEAQRGELHAEALMSVVNAVVAVGNAARSPAELEEAEAVLRLSEDSGLRRIAFAFLVAQSQTAGGWTDERRRRHGEYCQDTSALVAAAAQFTDLPPLAK